MKKLVLPAALLAFAAACGTDNPTSPTAALGPEIAGPSFDDVSNNIDNSIDAVAETMPLNAGGANGTTTLYIQPTNGDGKKGCNLTGSTTLGVAVSSSNTAVATVSPSSLTFTSCGEVKTLTVTPVTGGTATISVTQTSNNTGATFNLASASFTVTVAAPAPSNTAPTIAVTGVTEGTSYAKGSVPAARCEVTDKEDGNSSFAATLSAITGPYASDGIGSQTASCSYTDGGGLTATSSLTYSVVDPSAPTISSLLTPPSPDGQNGWYKSVVTLAWTVGEPQSPNSLQKTGCVDQNITADGEFSFSCSATSAGGAAALQTVAFKRDATAPTMSGAVTSPTTAPSASGWYKSDVTVSFTCADNLSGVASCAGPITLSTEGADLAATATAAPVDNAGNTGTAAAVSGIKLDKTPPTVSLVGGPANSSSHYFGSVPAAPTCSASDALSGVDGSCSVTGYGTTVGTHTVTASVTDKAGNTSSVTATYTVLAWTLSGFYAPVKMVDANGKEIVNTIRAGQAVPLKFNVYAGTTEKTTTDAVQKFSATQISCSASATTEPVEITNTGSTSLRYDGTAMQFVQNWATPQTANSCYRVTILTLDGSSITAVFQTK